ncbi:LysM domain-containing protein [Phlyctema vagabunda]|uniref:LysM domain-containing protein n=1 Tax=Phlyctema vagabunda TaxID=108571 RepID=A0ABR4PE93_9HELO
MHLLSSSWIWATFLLRTSLGQDNTTAIDPDLYPGASQACLSSLSTSGINCNPLVYSLYSNYYTSLELDEVTDLCKDACYVDLQAHMASVTSACQGVQYYDESTGSYYPPNILDLQALSGFNQTCFKNNNGQFCETYFQNTTNQNACDYCWIKLKQEQLNTGLDGLDTDLASSFSALTKSCGSTQFATTTPTAVVLTTSVAPTPTCAGSKYTSKAGDTIYSVSLSQKIATDTLLNRNGLSYDQGSLATGTSLCIAATCDVYVLNTNETCNSIASAAGISTIQLQTWNTNINPLCNNLARFVNSTFCISNPAGNYTMPVNNIGAPTFVTTAAPEPTNVGQNTTTRCGRFYEVKSEETCQTISQKFSIPLDDFYFLNPEVNTNCTNLLADVSYCVQPVGYISTYPGYGGTTSSSIQPDTTKSVAYTPFSNIYANPTGTPIPLANGTRVDCVSYSYLLNNTVLDCWSWAAANGLSSDELVLWNPSLGNGTEENADATYNYPCTPAVSESYCVALAYATSTVTATTAPAPRASGEVKDCAAWFQVTADYTCDDMLGDTGMTIDEFYAMNPSVKNDCTGLNLGTYYCYESPSLNNNGDGTMTGPVGTVSATSTGTGSPTKTSAAGVTGTNGVVTPTPTQTGMVGNCNKFHFVTSADTGCYDLAAANNIALSDFYSWNPAIGNDCSHFITGVYVCVGTGSSNPPTTTSKPVTTTVPGNGISTPTPTQTGMTGNCNKFHFVTSSDTGCYDLAAANSISLDQFYSWNPAVGNDCSHFITGVYVCIGVIGTGSPTTTSNKPTSTSSGNGIVTPTPHQPNMVGNCKKFDETKASNDYCYDISSRNSISVDDFEKWNPGSDPEIFTKLP